MGRYYRRRYHKRKLNSLNEEKLERLIILFILLLSPYIIYLVITSIVSYIKKHSTFFSVFGILVILGLIAFGMFYIKIKIKQRKDKNIFEKEQISKGLVNFIDRFKTVRWGKSKDVEKWIKEDEEAKDKEKLINQIISEINCFTPVRTFHNEFAYQVGLAQHLKSKFPDTDIEKQRGSSRPDIVVEDIAIEIKGPTRHKELDTIASKCARYNQHFKEIIIVLFEVEVMDRYYNEWKKSIEDTFPQVKIIRK